jgi:hypothetical protein
MGKGHFTCLGCNGYFAAGHWGGDGGTPTGGDSSLYYYRNRESKRKNVKPLLAQIHNLLETLKGE